ncbi:hypothetical protein [Actinoplanes sp. NPDC049599]
MSQRQLDTQRAEVIDRNRQQRLATQAEAQRLADARRTAQEAAHAAEQVR